MRLVCTGGGQVVLRLSGALVQGLLARLAAPAGSVGMSSVAPAPPLPVTPAEGGMVAAVMAAALADLARGQLVLDDFWAPPLDGFPGEDGLASEPGEAYGGGSFVTPPDGASAIPQTGSPATLFCDSLWSLSDDVAGWLHAGCDALAAEALARAARLHPPPIAAARAASLGLAFDFIAAEARTTARVAASLAPGDVIAFPHSPPAGQGSVRGYLSLDGWRAPALLERTPEGRHLTLFEEETTMSERETDAPLADPASRSPASRSPGSQDPLARMTSPGLGPPEDRLEQLPVRVSVTLGQVTLSAADVLRLAPGAVIELREPLGGPVEVLAGGRPFARGELVEVDGALGVRITSLASSALLP